MPTLIRLGSPYQSGLNKCSLIWAMRQGMSLVTSLSLLHGLLEWEGLKMDGLAETHPLNK